MEMKLLTFIACLLFVGCSAAPPEPHKDIVVTDIFFRKEYIIYTAKHDIVKLFVPLYQFNEKDLHLDKASSGSEETEHHYTVFFVEGDVNENDVTYEGLYILKNGEATKLLDNGRDITATNTNEVYFGAVDGIYKYDSETNSAVKHGTVTDNIIQLAYNNKTNSIYYLNADYEVYKLNEDATSAVKVSNLKNVQEMVFGFEGNLYYYNSDKVFYVLDIEANGTPRKIQDLPAKIDKVMLIAPFYNMKAGAISVLDKYIYVLRLEESLDTRIKIEIPVAAAAPQAFSIQFHAKDKKIYEFDIADIIKSKVFDGLEDSMFGNKNVISFINPAS